MILDERYVVYLHIHANHWFRARFQFISCISPLLQAAYVPAGRNGIGAQLAGKGFASITSPPSPDTSPPEGDDGAKMSDYILSRAKQHVKLGELEQSISELDKLKGQTAFTINDWKSAAMDRIAVDKALKVIKMECALLNKNMSG